MTGTGAGDIRTGLHIHGIGAARGIIYISFEIGDALFE